MATTTTPTHIDRRWVLAEPARVPLHLTGRFVMAMALIVMNAADLVTTRLLLDVGGRETNPIANHFLERGTLPVVKVGLAGVIGVLLLIAPLRRRAESVLWIVSVAYFAVLCFHLVQLGIRAG